VATRVAINGFGRIGRLVFRNLIARSDEFEVVAINDLTKNETLAHLLKYDSIHGRFDGTVECADKGLLVNGKLVQVFEQRNPAELPWKKLEIDVAIESTGVFNAGSEEGRPGFDSHLDAGAKRVVISAPAKGDKLDLMCVLGVNDDQLKPDMKCVSNASCTTNCLAPLAKVLHDEFGIVKGLMTTVHAYTNDQNVQDLPHKNLYRARAAAQNIIPTSTGAATAVGKVIPELAGRLTGMAMRVPVGTGSVVDLTTVLKKNTTAEEINKAVRAEAESNMKGILAYVEDPIVSSDVIGDSHSSLFASDWTTVIDGNLAKTVSWYDNEWGYSCRTVDLVAKLGAM